MRRLIRRDLEQRATDRQASSLYGIGAAVDRELTGRQAGRTWICAATDAVNGFRWIEVDAPRATQQAQVEPEFIERFVEREVGRFSIETRLDDLAQASPLSIELYLADAA
jgi:hypothetical protein